MIVVLAILKWIGIILLSIVGLLLFFVVLLLFVPVRYVAVAEYQECFRYAFRVGWLFPLFYIRKSMKKQDIFLYVLGIPVKSLSRDGGRKKKQKEEKKETEDSVLKQHEQEGQEKTKKPEVLEKSKTTEQRKQKKVKNNKKKKTKKSFSFESVSSIMKFIRDKEIHSAFRKLKRELWSVLCYLSPRRMWGEFRIGTGDPASTGLMIGGISLMPFVYQKGVHIVPDFENKVFRGNCKIRGRIRVIYFVRLLLRLYRDKELRRVWNRLNKKEAA